MNSIAALSGSETGNVVPRLIRRSATAGLAFIIILVCYAALAPLDIRLPGLDLDPSWTDVLGNAARLHLIFGKDIVFTSGPLSPIYTGYYPAQQFWRVLPFFLLVIGGLARFVWLCCQRGASIWRSAAILAALVCAIWDRDVILLALPLLVALATVNWRVGWASLLLGTAAVAAAGLAKFSIVIFAVPLLLLADGHQVGRRRPPLLFASFTAFLFFMFVLLEGEAEGFPNFVYLSFQLGAGYTEAMQRAGNSAPLFAFLIVGLSLVLAAFLGGMQAVRARRQPPMTACVNLLALGLYLFMLWKEGFVRQDYYHHIAAFAGLPLACAAYGALANDGCASLRMDSVFPLATMLLVGLILAKGAVVSPAARIGRELGLLASFTREPERYLSRAADGQEQAWTRIRQAARLPAISGTVDIVPSIQSLLIADHLPYRPRMTIQEYTTYTRALITANRKSWFGPHGPATIIFGFTPVDLGWTPSDGRLPALTEGPLWPELFRFYEPAAREGDLLALRRRAAPLPDLLGGGTWREARLGTWIPLPREGGAMFLSVVLRRTMAGRVLSLLYKPGMMFIETETMDGRRSRFRLVPGIAENGFVVSPQVTNTEDFRRLACGYSARSERIRAFRIVAEREPVATYALDYRYRQQAIDIALLRTGCAPVSRTAPASSGRD
jgi:hypothetical protein